MFVAVSSLAAFLASPHKSSHSIHEEIEFRTPFSYQMFIRNLGSALEAALNWNQGRIPPRILFHIDKMVILLAPP